MFRPGTLTYSLLFLLTMWPARSANAQTVRPDTLSASLLRRLAEAADGYRTGRPAFVVVQRDLPHDVSGVFASRPAADSAALSAGSGYRAYGPFVTPPDFDPVSRVIGVTLTVRGPRGLDTISIDPLKVDAIMWSAAAADKFCVEHYKNFMPPPLLAQFRERLMEGIRQGGFSEHWAWSLCAPR